MKTKIFDQFMASWVGNNCLSCGTDSLEEEFCGICEKGIEWDLQAGPGGSRSPFLYTDVIRKAIIHTKFYPSEIKAHALIRYAFRCVQIDQLMETFSTYSAHSVCFVPVHWKRRLRRGFDFSALLANAIGDRLKLPVSCAVRCVRLENPSTLGASREDRLLRVKDRFRLRYSYPTGTKIILVDDIVTTGATLHAVSALFNNAGCQVKCFTLARNI